MKTEKWLNKIKYRLRSSKVKTPDAVWQNITTDLGIPSQEKGGSINLWKSFVVGFLFVGSVIVLLFSSSNEINSSQLKKMEESVYSKELNVSTLFFRNSTEIKSNNEHVRVDKDRFIYSSLLINNWNYKQTETTDFNLNNSNKKVKDTAFYKSINTSKPTVLLSGISVQKTEGIVIAHKLLKNNKDVLGNEQVYNKNIKNKKQTNANTSVKVSNSVLDSTVNTIQVNNKLALYKVNFDRADTELNNDSIFFNDEHRTSSANVIESNKTHPNQIESDRKQIKSLIYELHKIPLLEISEIEMLINEPAANLSLLNLEQESILNRLFFEVNTQFYPKTISNGNTYSAIFQYGAKVGVYLNQKVSVSIGGDIGGQTSNIQETNYQLDIKERLVKNEHIVERQYNWPYVGYPDIDSIAIDIYDTLYWNIDSVLVTIDTNVTTETVIDSVTSKNIINHLHDIQLSSLPLSFNYTFGKYPLGVNLGADLVFFFIDDKRRVLINNVESLVKMGKYTDLSLKLKLGGYYYLHPKLSIHVNVFTQHIIKNSNVLNYNIPTIGGSFGVRYDL